MSIEEKIFQMARRWGFEKPGPENDELFKAAIREALAEQAEVHAIELRAYEATVANLVQALRGVIRVADRDTVEFDAAKAAILNAVGEHHA